jgi:hypothetical protein
MPPTIARLGDSGAEDRIVSAKIGSVSGPVAGLLRVYESEGRPEARLLFIGIDVAALVISVLADESALLVGKH